jgi:hypothetical protein
MKEVSTVLEQISADNSFDNFIHYAELDRWSREADIPLTEWQVLIDEWPYDPAAFMAKHARGNCADFAAYTVRELGSCGIVAYVAGVISDNHYSTTQQTFTGYNHSLVLGEHDGERFLCEPGWNTPWPAPIATKAPTKIDNRIFHTAEINERFLRQHYYTSYGGQGERTIDLEPLEPDEQADLIKNNMRIPNRNRNMTLIPSLHNDPEQYWIISDRESGLLKTSSPDLNLPEHFHPSQLSERANRKLSGVYGFDVKEELLACYAIRKAMPADFWVK